MSAVGEELKPEERKLREDPAFIWNSGCENVVKRGDAICCNKQQNIRVYHVYVADFTAGVERDSGKICFEDDLRQALGS